MVTYRLYIEGGGRADPPPGQTNRAAMIDSNTEAFRRGWQRFFNKAGVDGQILEIAVGGGQEEAFKLFSKQLAFHGLQQTTESKPLLLVDSEEPVASGNTVWQHLQTRSHNSFQRPAGADDQSAYMMVQAMETWFIADLTALQHFFGVQFDASVFENFPALETILKEDALEKLRQSSFKCKPRYRKSKVSYDLLAQINPDTVADACPHANQLLTYLRTL